MSQLTLYYHPASFYSQRALFGIAEKHLSCQKHVVSIHTGEQLEPWYIRIQPKGTVPALVHGDIVKTDSQDIILYLDGITPNAPKLLPDPTTPDGERAAYFHRLLEPIEVELITHGAWCYRQYTQDSMAPLSMAGEKFAKEYMAVKITRMKQAAAKYPELHHLYHDKLRVHAENDVFNEDKLVAALSVCDSVMAEIEEELSKRWSSCQGPYSDEDPWLCCKQFTIADIYLATFLHRMVMTGLAKRFWADGKRPYIAAYYARVQQRESFKTASGNANKMFRSVILPKVSYYIRKSMPRVTGVTLVVAIVGFGIYVKYKGFPSWWPNVLKLWR